VPGLALGLSGETLGLNILALLSVVLAVCIWRWWRSGAPTPHELERRRREAIAALGKIGDANVIEVQENHVIYSYEVGGVAYTASQDISGLEVFLPEDPFGVIGAVSVKYDPKNPANSIVVAQDWSGLRTVHPRT
jgi:hypothetical protein